MKYIEKTFNHGDATVTITNKHLIFKSGDTFFSNLYYTGRKREHDKFICFSCSFAPYFGVTFKTDPLLIKDYTLTFECITCQDCMSDCINVKSNNRRVILLRLTTENIVKMLSYFDGDCKTKLIVLILANKYYLRNAILDSKIPLFDKLYYYYNIINPEKIPKYECVYFEYLDFFLNKNISVIRNNSTKIYNVQRCLYYKNDWIKFHNNPIIIANFLYNCINTAYKIQELYTLIHFLTPRVIFYFTANCIIRNCKWIDPFTIKRCPFYHSKYHFLKYYFDRNRLTDEQNKEIWNLIITLKAYNLIKKLSDMNIIYPCDKFTFILTELNEKVIVSH